MKRSELFKTLSAPLMLRYDPREAYSAAYVLARGLFGLERIDFLIEPDREVDTSQVDLDRVVRELSWWRPVQYIVGSVEFCGFPFHVREGVLIPRPETEELVMWIANDPGIKETAPDILDCGTGSGCIAVSLAKLLPGSRVGAIDISDDALKIAQENADLNQAEVNLSKLDMLAAPDEWRSALPDGSFDIIVSNPPYVPIADKETICFNVIEYEPMMAIFTPQADKILYYRALAVHAKRLLRPGGRLYFEIYETMGKKITELLVSEGFTDVEVREDLSGKPRMIRCRA